MGIIVSLLVSILILLPGAKAQDNVVYSVYLIGDTGKDTIAPAALQLLAFESFDDSLSSIIMLGDNLYPSGIRQSEPLNETTAGRALVSRYEQFVSYRGNIHILPGERDWSNGKTSGLKALNSQMALSNEWFRKNSIAANRDKGVFFPMAGTPGPVSVTAKKGSLRIVLLDSQWWLQGGIFHPTGSFPGKNRKETKHEALRQLDSIVTLSSGMNEILLVAAHHPLISNGKRVHHLQPFRFLFNYTPLHLISSLGMNRKLRQDLRQPRYKRYRRSMEKILQQHPSVLYVAAHELNMQYMVRNGIHHIISGSGSMIKELDRYIYKAIFMDDLQNGFFKISLLQSGKVMLHAFGTNDRGEYWKKHILSLPVAGE